MFGNSTPLVPPIPVGDGIDTDTYTIKYKLVNIIKISYLYVELQKIQNLKSSQ